MSIKSDMEQHKYYRYYNSSPVNTTEFFFKILENNTVIRVTTQKPEDVLRAILGGNQSEKSKLGITEMGLSYFKAQFANTVRWNKTIKPCTEEEFMEAYNKFKK